MKLTISAGIGIFLGLLAGVLMMYSQYQNRVTGLEMERLELARSNEQLQEQVAALQAHAEALEGMERARADVPPETIAAPEPAPAAEPVFPLAAFEEASRPRDRVRGGNEEDEDGNGEDDEERRQDRRERMQQFMDMMRDRAGNFLAAEAEQSDDPVVQQRLVSIADHFGRLMDLGVEMRQAETDEARDAVRTQIEQARDALARLVDEQQNYMTRSLAEDFGITDPGKQQEFIGRLDELRSNPMFFGGGVMRGFGGFGGPPGRGRGGPGGPGDGR